MGTYAVNIYWWLMCKITVTQRTIESKTNMQYILKIICLLQSLYTGRKILAKLLSILINTLWTHRCSAFTKDLPVIKIRVAHPFSVLCSPIMCLYVLLMSINDREYWSGRTKWTIHRNWQRMSHKTKNKNQTKTSKKRTQCALEKINQCFFYILFLHVILYCKVHSVWYFWQIDISENRYA
jgi:hypothetical protein